jgi:hypothetical protein
VWRRCAKVFAEAGQRWGANVLVDDAACAALPATLAELAAAGCDDASLLGYVGEPARVLSPSARRRLADIALSSPLPCRVSVCFGSSLGVPRLLAGFDNDNDCGAGSDFVTVTPDQRVQSCSFQQHGFPGATAREILAAWRTRRAALAQPSPRSGCARLLRDAFEPAALPEIAIWQGFSGNNSGECILVAKFQTVDGARAYLEELLPGWTPGQYEDDSFSAVWRELFEREQVAGASLSRGGYRSPPQEIVHVGKSVLATGYGVDDNFPELRALAWKRGARVLPGGIHVHEPSTLFGAIAARDDRDRDELVRGAEKAGTEAFIHGRTVFVPVSPRGNHRSSWTEDAETLLALAAGRPVAAELLSQEWTKDDVVTALQRLGDDLPERQRLWIRFSVSDGQAEARRLAGTLADQRVVLGSTWLLVDPVLGRKRVAVLAYRLDAEVSALDAERVIVKGYFWRDAPQPQKGKKAEKAPMPTAEDLAEALRRRGPHLRDVAATRRHDYNDGISVELLTVEPGYALTSMGEAATELGLRLGFDVSDPEPVRAMLGRLRSDLATD